MFELLYSTDAASKTFPLSGLSVLSTVLEWCMASWSPLHTVNDMGCDKTLNTALKSAHFVPGAYIDETLLRVTSCLRSPSVPKISSPGPGTPVMPCTEICESPVQDGSCAPFVKGSPEDQQYDDTPGYISDESDPDTTSEADVYDEDGFGYRRSNTYDSQRFEIGHRAPLIPSKELPDLPPILTDKLSRKTPPLKRVLSRVFPENGADPKSPASMTGILSKAQHDLTHLFTRHDPIPLDDSQGTSSSSYEDSPAKVRPRSSPATPSRLPGVVTATDTFEHPTHTVTRTVIRPSPSHSLFSLPFKRPSSSSGPKQGSKSHFRTPESTPIPDAQSMFEEELDASLQRWGDEREGRNAMDVYVIVDREMSHEESWRSLVQEVHYNRRPPTKKLSGECGRW